MADLPAYDDLPVADGAPPGSSWGLWGDGDVLGCLNLLTTDRVLAGLASVRSGAVFPLDLELELPFPPLFGRPAFTHEVRWLGGGDAEVARDEVLHGWNTQSSSQWDGFRHIPHPVHGFYGGVADEGHGVHHWARHGIVGRAVLVDLAGFRQACGRPLDPASSAGISAEDVVAALESQGVEIETGDILLLNTGWLAWYLRLGIDERARLAAQAELATPGLLPGQDTARLLWDLHVAAVAADNPAVEQWPPGGVRLTREQVSALNSDPAGATEQFLHFSLLPLLGLPLGELWNLEALVNACRADERWTCLLVSAPLNLSSGVASTANAIAIR